ncbi:MULTISPECIES: hypothetical protein [unclassified Nocardioides]|uniref:hypothetical protein n=1 Tax=unclassified Nocardioides TaxID=2615069 RepID=UPI000701E4FB|nr:MULTISPECIES: hypothetical protein [unclassified Nocardioides]KRA32479.1 hypothetical protein ASD81_13025 [Nocardioides sp. Root614]KRA89133.1 hypothetical protein ASD84_13290 [Nocardioides sp. Root682]
MFGRRKAKRAAAAQAVPPPTEYPVCGQVYLFNREAERAAREAAEAAESPVGEAEVQPRD